MSSLELDGPSVVLVESDPSLRSALVRALVGAGFPVSTQARLVAASHPDRSAGAPLFVVDLDAPGAERWLTEAGARAVSVFLATDAGLARRIERVFGPEVDVLVKPFAIERLEERLAARHRLRIEARRAPLDPILQTRDPRLAQVLEKAHRLALQGGPVCIVGELGTGRRALALAIHAASPNAGEPCRTLATDALPPALEDAFEIEEEGRGAGSPPRVPLVDLGTLVVREPADWSRRAQLAFQARLREAGDGSTLRCITLAREPLEASMAEGRLETELAYRLAGPVLRLPPLRERVLDQLDYCTALGRRLAQELGVATPRVDRAFVDALARDGFPGNRLGVEHRLRRRLLDSELAGEATDSRSAWSEGVAGASGAADAGGSRAVADAPELDLRTLERSTIVRALERMHGNRTHASRALGISVRTLRNKIREYGLR